MQQVVGEIQWTTLQPEENSVSTIFKLGHEARGECIYSATQSLRNSVDEVNETGCIKSLFLNLSTFQLVSKKWLSIDVSLTTRALPNSPVLYLEIRHHKNWKSSEQLREEGTELLSKQKSIAAGSDQGLRGLNSALLYETTITYHIHCLPNGVSLALPADQSKWGSYMPEDVLKRLQDLILILNSAKAMDNATQVIDESHITIDNLEIAKDIQTVTVAPGEWKCQDCGKMKNLWINLSDGYIGCGRRQYGIEDSGCTNGREGAAIRHYEANPNYHVCVKLGTLSPLNVEAYSYKADDFVVLPNIDEYLQRIGLSRDKLQQTEVSTRDLAVEKNQSLFIGLPSTAEERSRQVIERGFLGITNVGNTCYVATVIQMMAFIYAKTSNTKWGLDTLTEGDCDIYLQKWVQENGSLNHNTIPHDFTYQFLRLTAPLHAPICKKALEWKNMYEERHKSMEANIGADIMKAYVPVDPKFEAGVPSPYFLKQAVGRRNREFLTGFQQDAEEFYNCLMSMLENTESVSKSAVKARDLLCMMIEEKWLLPNGTTRLSTLQDVPLLALNMEKYKNRDDEVDMFDLLDNWHTGMPKQGLKKWPQWLVLQARRLTESPTYEAVKINTPLKVPHELDMAKYAAEGILEGERLESSDDMKIDSSLSKTLQDFGFSLPQIKLAVQALGPQETVEKYAEWIFEHPDASPLIQNKEVDQGAISNIIEMGFDQAAALEALRKNHGDLQAAVNWLMEGNYQEHTEGMEESSSQEAVDNKKKIYDLNGVIIHLGSNARSGHYVIYLKKGDSWHLFNDSMVSRCEGVPDLRLGYLFLYSRRV